jgi:hypothetical protein
MNKTLISASLLLLCGGASAGSLTVSVIDKDGKPVEISLDKAGVLGSTLLGCFIHGSMRGQVYASESP